MSDRRLRVLAVALFVVGAVVLLLAEATWLRLASTVVLLGFVAAALFAIATPEFLSRDREEEG